MSDSAARQRSGAESATDKQPLPARRTRDHLRAVLEAVAAPAEEIRHVLGTADEALMAFDAGRTILCANPKAEALFGYGPGELDGRSTDVVFRRACASLTLRRWPKPPIWCRSSCRD
jgi:PAS domain-containing protein